MPAPSAQTVADGGLVDEPTAPDKANSTFDGWYKEAGFATKWNFATDVVTSAVTTFTMPAADVTVTANFTYMGHTAPPNGYEVKYNANGGYGDYSATGYMLGGLHMVNHSDFAGIGNVGYTFIGWNTKADGTGMAFAPGETITILGNVELFAQWVRDVQPLELDGHIRYYQGYPDSTVRPDNPITRAEVSAIFFRLLTNETKNQVFTQKFDDVPDGRWYSQYVNYLAELGIINGYPDGTFMSEQPITRAEFVTISARLQSERVSDTERFSFSEKPENRLARRLMQNKRLDLTIAL